jgi:hypothetical protein
MEREIEVEFEKAIREIETRIGVVDGFFDALFKEDDWSFIIKAHALLEAACSEILAERVGTETLSIFSRLELGAKPTGKISFLKAFDLLRDEERRFVSALSELRNQLVHNVKNTSFCLPKYVASLDPNQKKIFIDGFGFVCLREDADGKHSVVDGVAVVEQPKKAIWLSLKFVLAIISVQMDTLRHRREISAALLEHSKLLRSSDNAGK